MLPLSPDTRSGRLIEEIENQLKNDIHFYKTNLVKCLPLKVEKIRYPLKHEMDKCFPNLEDELEALQPTLVFLLGKQVSDFVLKKNSIKNFSFSSDYKYQTFKTDKTTFVPIHHPSYILIYRRKELNKYIKGVHSLIKEFSNLNTDIIG